MDMEFRYLDISAVTKGRIDWSATQMWKYADAPSRARRRLRSGDVLLCTVRPGLQAHARICQYEDVPLVGSTGFAVLRPNLADDSGFVFHQIFSDSVAAQLRALETGSSYPAVNEGDVRRVRVFCPEKEERWRIAAVLDTVDEAIAKTEAVVAKLRQVRAGLLHDLLTRGLDPHGQLRDPIAHPEQFRDSPLGRIPREWDVKPLDSCVFSEITYGIVQAGPHVEGGVPYIRTGDMSGDRLVLDQMMRTSPEIAARFRRSRVQAGEIVCAIRATVGKVLPVPPELDGANLTQGTARIAPKAEIDPSYLLWTIRSDRTQRQIAREAKGTTFFEITLTDLRQVGVMIPSRRPEQEQIASAIQSLETRLTNEANGLSKLQHLKSGLKTDLLTGRVRVRDTIHAG